MSFGTILNLILIILKVASKVSEHWQIILGVQPRGDSLSNETIVSLTIEHFWKIRGYKNN